METEDRTWYQRSSRQSHGVFVNTRIIQPCAEAPWPPLWRQGSGTRCPSSIGRPSSAPDALIQQFEYSTLRERHVATRHLRLPYLARRAILSARRTLLLAREVADTRRRRVSTRGPRCGYSRVSIGNSERVLRTRRAEPLILARKAPTTHVPLSEYRNQAARTAFPPSGMPFAEVFALRRKKQSTPREYGLLVPLHLCEPPLPHRHPCPLAVQIPHRTKRQAFRFFC